MSMPAKTSRLSRLHPICDGRQAEGHSACRLSGRLGACSTGPASILPGRSLGTSAPCSRARACSHQAAAQPFRSIPCACHVPCGASSHIGPEALAQLLERRATPAARVTNDFRGRSEAVRWQLLTFASQGLEHRLERGTHALCTGSFPVELLEAEALSPRQFP
jgi:hypothetical protein